MNILDAIRDPELFRPFLQDRDCSISTWRNWMIALRVLYGLPIKSKHHDLIRQCTGRDPAKLPPDGFDTALLLCGRRSGKSRIAACCGLFHALLAGHESKLAKGEQGLVACLAPTKPQSTIVREYLRSLTHTRVLAEQVVAETKEGFDLKNGIRIVTITGDHKAVRGFTLLAAIVDEAAFFGVDEASKVKSDTELIRAIQPSLATVRGKLISITTPFQRAGFCWSTYKKHFGNDKGKILVWNAASTVMNPTLPQDVVDDALAEDLQAAKSEYLAEFRDSLAAYISRAIVDRLVVKGRRQLIPQPGVRYSAFVDLAGGGSAKGDDGALAIAHKEGQTIVLDVIRQYRPPFNPYQIVGSMVAELRKWNIRHVTADLFSAGFVGASFGGYQIAYQRSQKNKSELYAEMLPRLSSGQLELLDDETLIRQLCSLERRVRSGGRDIIDHPRSGKDDCANALAGVVQIASQGVITVGALGGGGDAAHRRLELPQMQRLSDMNQFSW